MQSNNLKAFKEFLTKEDKKINENSNAIQYSYGLTLNLFKQKEDGNYVRTNPSQVMNSFGELGDMIVKQNSMMGMNMSSTAATDVFTEMLDNQDLLKTQYDVLSRTFSRKI